MPENLSLLHFFLEFLEKLEFCILYHSFIDITRKPTTWFLFTNYHAWFCHFQRQYKINQMNTADVTALSNMRYFDSLSSEGKFFWKKADNLRRKICQKIEFLRIFAWVLVFLALSFFQNVQKTSLLYCTLTRPWPP